MAVKTGQKYNVTIEEKGDLRYLLYNRTIHSVFNTKGLYTGIYHDYFLPLPLLYKNPRILVIGLGGGTIPFLIKKMYGAGVSIDVVEREPRMVFEARRFLRLKKFGFKIIIAEGFDYVKRTHSKYDIIILDAFINDTIPPQFLTTEFAEISNRALKKNGTLAINYAPSYLFMHLYIHRLSRFFKVYRIRNMLFGNYILLCSKAMDKEMMKNAIKRGKVSLGDEGSFLIKAYSKL